MKTMDFGSIFQSKLPVIPSARQGSDHAPGYAFRSWRYATATVALVQKLGISFGLKTTSRYLPMKTMDFGSIFQSKLAQLRPFNDSDLPVIPSARQGSDHAPGYAFRSWRYATATVVWLEDDESVSSDEDDGLW
jgi:hypothetical protein